MPEGRSPSSHVMSQAYWCGEQVSGHVGSWAWEGRLVGRATGERAHEAASAATAVACYELTREDD